jgi:type II secretory pathway pseudopilin PulG
MEKNISKSAAGVSILEIMISLVLVAIALMAITSTFPSINKNRKGIQEADQAKILATQVLEGVQFLMIDGGCTGFTPAEEQYKKDCEAFRDKYKPPKNKVTIGIVEYEVILGTPSSTAASWGGKTIDVNVKWTKSGKPHNVKVTGAI